ncbi:hypothetical protein DSO57_1003464 [Entomophthora muscae]|uniref:Uncharacterized protein n=1 Tax=Entomophthora muscae TaxID=34485 RepID=A0ACC2UV06_9FUNG|nr:hypothetical protein DSO57_1003464 [Entomophthora muscae]
MNALRCKLFCFSTAIISMLGIEFNSPCREQWLERRLALYAFNLELYYSSASQSLPRTYILYVPLSKEHLSKTYLLAKIKQGRVTSFSDLIHFITFHCLNHSFCIVTTTYREFSNALASKSTDYDNCIIKNLRLLQENFHRGWVNLARLANTPYPELSSLLLNSRITLAMRYHSDLIRITGLATQTPVKVNQPLTLRPTTNLLAYFTHQGLASSIRLISILSALNMEPFHIQPLRLLTTAISFITLHYRTSKYEYTTSICLIQSLRQAKDMLVKALDVPLNAMNARIILGLMDVLFKRNKISLKV